MTVDMEKTGQNIRKMMEYAGMKVQDLADICGCSRIAVYKWFKGINVPSIDNLVLLSDAFGLSIDDIVARDTEGERWHG